MIAYEIQLRYVIEDKIQSETKFSPRQIQSETKFSQEKNFCQKKQIIKKKKKKKKKKGMTYLYLAALKNFQLLITIFAPIFMA